jgi:hypothetical protein
MKNVAFVILFLQIVSCNPKTHTITQNTIQIPTFPPQWTQTSTPSGTSTPSNTSTPSSTITLNEFIPSYTLSPSNQSDISTKALNDIILSTDVIIIPTCGYWVSEDTSKYEFTIGVDSTNEYKFIDSIFVITRYIDNGIRGIHLSCLDLLENIRINPDGTFTHELEKGFMIEGRFTDKTHGHVKYNIPPQWCNYDGKPLDLSSIISDETYINSI